MAATMYFLLTLKLPPESVNRSYHDELIAPRLLNPTLSPNLERVLLKAMSVDADPTISNGGFDASYAYTQGAMSQVQSQSQGTGRQSVPQPAPAPTPTYQY